ncbi:MAG TPA: hypothetical protein VMS18_26995 [Candidatus Binatia bacterium]|nr:hypothetical protein [Candidatus Binatia bacterium]
MAYARRLVQGGPVIHLFPEEAVVTQMRVSFLFSLMRVIHAHDLDIELEARISASNPTLWLPQVVIELFRSEFSASPEINSLITKWSREIRSNGSETYVPLRVADFSEMYRICEATGLADQIVELTGALESPIWISAEAANKFKAFAAEHKLHESDRNFRILLISATCQCRGKSVGTAPKDDRVEPKKTPQAPSGK